MERRRAIMTAEIVVMNTSGIALAADSAVTIGNDRKVYHSANKLFVLSKHHPVGIMVYGTSSLFNVPWETLIKLFSKELNDRVFDTLHEYVEAFINFLNQNKYEEFMSKNNEVSFIHDSLEFEINTIHKYLTNLKEDLYSEYGELYIQNEIQDLYIHHGGNFLRKRLYDLEEKEFIHVFDGHDFDLLFEKYGKEVEIFIHRQFEPHMFVEEWIDEIKFIVIHSLLKEFSDAKSGIVFAGFGEMEIYPSVISFYVEGKINGKLKYHIIPKRTKRIDHSLIGTILPFAQSDMVNSFITGTHIEIEKYAQFVLKKELEALSNGLTEQLKDTFKDDLDLETIEKTIETEILKTYHTFNKHLLLYQRNHFIKPITNVVGTLPITELAQMAEALLNITSFKFKMSSSLETVGDPIDVAVITKGDGFTWVKRK